jgi:uroporphyrinogen-III synthase
MRAVLVVRKFDNFSRTLTANEFPVINCPSIETVRHENSRTLGAQISAKNYDGIFLTSRRSAEILCEEAFDKNFAYGGRVYVLGKSSFEQLQGKNLDLFFRETANTAQELLALIPPADLLNKRFLFIRGDRSLGAIPDFLKDRAALDEAIVYETRRITIDGARRREIEAKLNTGEILAACFFSPSGAESFLEQFGAQSLHQTITATIGKTTADFLEQKGLKVDFMPTTASAEDFAVELIDYLKEILAADKRGFRGLNQ